MLFYIPVPERIAEKADTLMNRLREESKVGVFRPLSFFLSISNIDTTLLQISLVLLVNTCAHICTTDCHTKNKKGGK